MTLILGLAAIFALVYAIAVRAHAAVADRDLHRRAVHRFIDDQLERARGNGGPRMTVAELVPRCPCGAVARFVRRDRGRPEYKCVICVELWSPDGLHPAAEELP